MIVNWNSIIGDCFFFSLTSVKYGRNIEVDIKKNDLCQVSLKFKTLDDNFFFKVN